jgi:hypothetical protein
VRISGQSINAFALQEVRHATFAPEEIHFAKKPAKNPRCISE